jgi:hypothetical protein
MYVEHNIEARSYNQCCSGKAIGVTYSECVFVDLVIQHAKCMSHTCCHMWPVWLYHIFPRYLINCTIFEKELLNKKCVVIFSTRLVWNIFNSKKNWETDDKNCVLAFKYPSFLSDFNETWIFPTGFQKVLKYQISLLSVQWELSNSMQTEGQTDMTNPVVALRYFANVPKNCCIFCVHTKQEDSLT